MAAMDELHDDASDVAEALAGMYFKLKMSSISADWKRYRHAGLMRMLKLSGSTPKTRLVLPPLPRALSQKNLMRRSPCLSAS